MQINTVKDQRFPAICDPVVPDIDDDDEEGEPELVEYEVRVSRTAYLNQYAIITVEATCVDAAQDQAEHILNHGTVYWDDGDVYDHGDWEIDETEEV